MKSKNVAFALSFLLPGAGLAYLGRWKRAALNLAVVLGAEILALVLPENVFDGLVRYLGLGFSGASGAWAMVTAEQMNARAAAAPSMEEVGEEARLG